MSGRTSPSNLVYNLTTIVNTMLVLTMLTVTGLAMWFSITALNQNSVQDQRIESLSAKELADVAALIDADAALAADLTYQFETADAALNATLCDKIMNSSASLQTEIDLLFVLLNATNTTGMNFTNFILTELMIDDATFASLNSSIVQEHIERITNITNLQLLIDALILQEQTNRIGNDTNIFNLLNASITQERLDRTDNVTTLQTALGVLDGSVVKTVNALPPTAGNIDIAVTTPGLSVANSGSTVTLANTGVLSISVNGTGLSVNTTTGDVVIATSSILSVNMVMPNMNHELFIDGTGGVQINNTLSANTITVDGSTLVTAITNLQADEVIQNAVVANLTAQVATQQTQINNLNMTGQMIADALNGTTITVNMTIMQLINDVMSLQSMVTTLQSQVANLTAVATPTGTISPWGGSNIPPTGWLLCDGTMVSIATYTDLYNVVGCKFCPTMAGCATDFCLPDLRGRTPVGASSTIGSAFNVPAGTSTVGEEKHTLTTVELPAHGHTFTTSAAGAHGHSVQLNKATSYNDNNANNVFDGGDTVHGSFTGTTVEQKCGCGGQSSAITFDDAGGAQPNRRILFDVGASVFNGAMPVSDHVHSGTTANTGSGVSHNVVQPSVVVAGFIIKT